MIEKKEYGVIAFSGGLDSTCLLIKMLKEYKEILAISFDYGQSNKVELTRAKAQVALLTGHGFNIVHNILDMSGLGTLLQSALTTGKDNIPEGYYKDEKMKATVVPNRNVIFGSIVYGAAQAIASSTKKNVDILLGVQQGEGSLYLDSRPESRDACEAAFKVSNYDSELVNYLTPYIEFDKKQILEDLLENAWYLKLNWSVILMNTLSSYNPDSQGRSSGTSSADIKRIEAFIQMDLVDPISYVAPWSEIVAHAKSVLKIA